METRVKGKQFEISDALRQYVDGRLQRLERYLDSVTDAQVEVAREATRSAADRFVVQGTLRFGGTIVRAEQKGADIHRAVDAMVETLHDRIVRFKEKHYRKSGHRRPESFGRAVAEAPAPAIDDELLDIVRVKRLPLKPMPAEEAVEQLELLGHDFYVFFDADSQRIAVLYRRKNGGYGLIDPIPA